MAYLDEVDQDVRRYSEVLVPEIPGWLLDYVEVPELKRLREIDLTCGQVYGKMLGIKRRWSNLDHSVAMALLIWRFTHDKKQVLAGLFHDIATPSFKHVIDFLEGDYERHESTESQTHEMIVGSKTVMNLLKRDKVGVGEVDDYHMYPVADNDTPQLAADRLEYSISNALFSYGLIDLKKAKRFLDDISVQQNEYGKEELGFESLAVARDFVKLTTRLSLIYRSNEARYSMEFLAEVMRRLGKEGVLRRSDLYKMSDDEVVQVIKASKYGELFEQWAKAKCVMTAKRKPKGVYAVKVKTKVRYINPLVKGKRITNLDATAKKMIDNCLAYDMSNYLYLDLDFEGGNDEV